MISGKLAGLELVRAISKLEHKKLAFKINNLFVDFFCGLGPAFLQLFYLCHHYHIRRWGFGRRESQFHELASWKGANIASSSRMVNRKWHSREHRKIDKEHDVVLVPSDGGCLSGSESDDSDYSIGWLEPHGPEFQSDDDTDNNFDVLIPCYGRAHDNVLDNTKNKIFVAITKIPNG
ncbi:hypothetical protein K2173_025890 [Erythroxylum novogranatense]|uniref:Uncharacterized protein n=1 Tax=Erythroxylum novogranatense TaxID=1862640 RepID=A0AAV8SHZ5_9ROSI|nr:hypothetical protein K2173_025890 [Erythroxylum novogranatense]